MTQSLQELLAQREAIEQAIENARKQEISSAVAQVRALVAQHGLTVRDVFPGRGQGAAKASGKASGKVAPKYRDPATGQTWTGRGKAPKWIDGKDRQAFAIA